MYNRLLSPSYLGHLSKKLDAFSLGPHIIVAGIDNWSVTITTEDPKQESVPEPSSILGLFALGGFGVRSLLLRISQ